MKPGQRVRVVRFDQNGFNKRVKMNGRTGTVRPGDREFPNFIYVELDEPWETEGIRTTRYGTKERPMKFLAFELEAM